MIYICLARLAKRVNAKYHEDKTNEVEIWQNGGLWDVVPKAIAANMRSTARFGDREVCWLNDLCEKCVYHFH